MAENVSISSQRGPHIWKLDKYTQGNWPKPEEFTEIKPDSDEPDLLHGRGIYMYGTTFKYPDRKKWDEDHSTHLGVQTTLANQMIKTLANQMIV